MQLFQYIAIRVRGQPELGALDPATTLAIARALGTLRSAVDELDDEDVAAADPYLTPCGPGWRKLELLVDEVDGDGDLPSRYDLETLFERLSPAARTFLLELVGYAGFDDEGRFVAGDWVELALEVADDREAVAAAIDRGRRARFTSFQYASSVETFTDVAPHGIGRDALLRNLSERGIAFASTAPAPLAGPPCVLLLWWWDFDETVYLFELPEPELSADERTDLAQIGAATFASPPDVEEATWLALHRTMARLGGDHMPVGGASLECASRWSGRLTGSVSMELGVRDSIDPGVLNRPLSGVVSVRRLA
jgi:hypothetical protein